MEQPNVDGNQQRRGRRLGVFGITRTTSQIANPWDLKVLIELLEFALKTSLGDSRVVVREVEWRFELTDLCGRCGARLRSID